MRVTAWVRRFVVNCRQRKHCLKENELPVEEVQKAEDFWLKRAQGEAFQTIEGEKSLYSLSPKMDEDGILRVNGRFRDADLPYAAKHPAILLRKHSLTKLIIRTVHERLGHGTGVEHTLTELRA